MHHDSRHALQRRLRPALVGTTITAIALIAACGGHDHKRTVSLKTKDDVLRELGNMAAFVDVSGVGGNAATAARAIPAVKRHFASTALKSRLVAGGQATPKAATVYDCDNGSYSSETLTGTYTFSLFDDTSRDVSIYREDNDNCVFEYDGGPREIYVGHYETGDHSPETGDHYAYLRFGSGSTAYRYREELSGDADYPTQEDVLGVLERQDTDSSSEVRGEDFRYHYSEPGYEASVTLGQDDILGILVTSDGLSIDGTVHYSTSTCSGGTLRYTTSTPIALPTDGTAQGEIEMESGNDSATITVLGGDGASIEFADGSTAALTSQELLAALQESPCTGGNQPGPL